MTEATVQRGWPMVAGLAGSAGAQGSKPFTLEARGGLAYPMETFDQGTKVGFLVGATAKYSPQRTS